MPLEKTHETNNMLKDFTVPKQKAVKRMLASSQRRKSCEPVERFAEHILPVLEPFPEKIQRAHQ